MARRDNLFDMIGILNESLSKWQTNLKGVTPDTPYAKTAQIYVEHSRDWIGPILDHPDYAKNIKDRYALKYLEDAVIVVGNSKPGTAESLVNACGAIDKALKRTYRVIREADFKIAEPITYHNTLSFLPGDPDFPTDLTIDPAAKPKTSLPDDVDSSTEIVHKRRSDEFDP